MIIVCLIMTTNAKELSVDFVNNCFDDKKNHGLKLQIRPFSKCVKFKQNENTGNVASKQ